MELKIVDKPKPNLNQNLNPMSYQKRGREEKQDNLKHKSGNFRMLLKVLMDFCSLQKETKHMHQHTYINRKEN